MIRNSMRILLGSTMVVVLLAGCQNTQGGAGTSAKPAVGTERITRPGNKDVEAPDVFSANEKALWDGRPSLGGVWVASPDASGPERVLITNTANGKTTTGALFKRERENPGPRLQLSSDAAEALGILAGQPATIAVVALRREEIVVQEASPAVSEDPAAEGAEKPAEGEAKGKPAATVAPADAAAIGAAAVAAVGKEAAGDAAGAALADPAATVAPPVKQRKGLFGGLFGGGKPKTPKGAEVKPAEPKAGAEGAPLSAIDPAAVAKTPAKAAPVATTKLDEKPATKAEANANATPTAPVAASGSVRIMIGAFSVESNAQAAAAQLQKAGLVPAISASKKGDKTIFTVTASGAGTGAEILAKVKSLGYSDAYVTK